MDNVIQSPGFVSISPQSRKIYFKKLVINIQIKWKTVDIRQYANVLNVNIGKIYVFKYRNMKTAC